MVGVTSGNRGRLKPASTRASAGRLKPASIQSRRWSGRRYIALLLFAAALQVSIAAAQILLGLDRAALAGVLVISRREQIDVPRMFWPLAAYAGYTLVSTAFSIDPAVSIRDDKQLLLFAIVPIAYRLLAGSRAQSAVDVLITVGAVSAAIGIVQFGILKFDDLGQRPRGALGLYMTYSGQLMLVACVAAARIMFRRQDRVWPMLVLPALLAALATTLEPKCLGGRVRRDRAAVSDA